MFGSDIICGLIVVRECPRVDQVQDGLKPLGSLLYFGFEVFDDAFEFGILAVKQFPLLLLAQLGQVELDLITSAGGSLTTRSQLLVFFLWK